MMYFIDYSMSRANGGDIKELLGDLLKKRVVKDYGNWGDILSEEHELVLDVTEMGVDISKDIEKGCTRWARHPEWTEKLISNGFTKRKVDKDPFGIYEINYHRSYAEEVAKCLGMKPVSYKADKKKISWDVSEGAKYCPVSIYETISKFFPDYEFIVETVDSAGYYNRWRMKNGEMIKEEVVDARPEGE